MVACAPIRPNGLTTRALEELEQENARLKKLVADQVPDISILRAEGRQPNHKRERG